MAKQDNDEDARQERNASIRDLIGRLKKGERLPTPRSPRDFTDGAADEADKDSEPNVPTADPQA
jgi:hypothetical protein